MADNPFEDPEVQAAASNNSGVGMPPPAPAQQYGDDNAYDDGAAMVAAAAKYVPAEQQKQIAISAGSAVANQAVNQAQADYDKAQATQGDVHSAPEAPTFCVQIYLCFPLRWAAFWTGACLIAGPILDLIFSKPNFIQFWIFLYLIGFGIVIISVESPLWKMTRPIQLKIFFWFRLLSRMWGRAWFYLFVSILCYASLSSDSVAIFSVVGGIMLSLVSILSFIFSKMAGSKFARIREFIAAGSENDEMEGRFLRKFDELDVGGQAGTIGSLEIIKLAEQAGRVLSNSERYAIQTFLDESCNGFVSKEDWMKQFVTQYQDKGFKQKYL